MALIAVLWTVLLVSVLIAGTLATVRNEIQEAAAQKRLFHAEQAMDNAIEHIKHAVQSRRLVSVRDLKQYRLETNDLEVRVLKVVDEGNKLDLNTATANTLQHVLMDAKMKEPQLAQLTDRILDWRDSDSSRREYGAERPEYLREGQEAPKNRSFFSTKELFKVLNTEQIIKPCMLSNMTIFGRSQSLHRPMAEDAAEVTTTEQPDSRQLTGRKLTVTMAAFDSGKPVATYSMVILATGRSEEPVLVLGSPEEPDDECALHFGQDQS